jgi:SAM-dependent methyltransferase
MTKSFFEGKSYDKGEFKGLIPKFYPKKYKQYIQEEADLLKSKVKGAKRVLEAGVGIGRLIPELAPIVKEFVGIDVADFMIIKSENIAKDFPNVKIIKYMIENLSNLFSENYFDYSLCVWNTLGNVKDSVVILKELKKITKKSIFITVFYKGTMKDRLDFYKSVDVNIIEVDKENGIFYSDSGLISRTFDIQDIKNLAKQAGLILKKIKILGGVILWAELVKNGAMEVKSNKKLDLLRS